MKTQRIVYATLALFVAIFLIPPLIVQVLFYPSILFILPVLLVGAGFIFFIWNKTRGASFDSGQNIEELRESPPVREEGSKTGAVALLLAILLMFAIIGIVLLRLRTVQM